MPIAPAQRERLFFVVTGLVEGMLTALTLASGRMLSPGDGMTPTLALRVGIAASLPTAVVFFTAEYARQRQELLRMAHQLNMVRHERLFTGRLGVLAWRESLISALASGFCSLIGALTPLIVASLVAVSGWTAIASAVACLGGLGAWIGQLTLSCRLCWALALMLAGGVLTLVGNYLQVV
jgi:predicted membrane protein (TIGR00267 family)